MKQQLPWFHPHLLVHAFKTVLVVVVVAIVCLPFVWYGWELWKFYGPNDQIHKYLMPGNYSTHLPAGKYGGWYFGTWLSKQIKADAKAQHGVLILGDTGESIPQVTMTGGIGDEYQEIKGEEEFCFELKKEGEYRVSSKSKDRFVFVIVPESDRYFSIGSSFTFDGFGGDFNFENAKTE
ncbi:MAG: hypothetical protein K2X81_14930 [Candidatus Obscuribacterales bacterium]|nr:hypothetical protein [Candidatus Obscuribacterales bacterium]